jgi:hypothetical protein
VVKRVSTQLPEQIMQLPGVAAAKRTFSAFCVENLVSSDNVNLSASGKAQKHRKVARAFLAYT